MSDPTHFCDALDSWANMLVTKHGFKSEIAKSLRDVRQLIRKSCLLDRMVYGGEKMSQTPCPVHNGRWSGIHGPWPETELLIVATGAVIAMSDVPISTQCQEWYDAGCRCAFHKGCHCTTGWQPDEHCGCVSNVQIATIILKD